METIVPSINVNDDKDDPLFGVKLVLGLCPKPKRDWVIL